MSLMCDLAWHDLRQVDEPDADDMATFRCHRWLCDAERRLSTRLPEDGRMWGTDDGTYQL